MTGLDVRLDGMEYADIFPFYLALDAESRVVRFGAAWTRVHPGIRRGMALSACCRIVRPAVALPSEHLTCLVGAFVVLESLEVGLRLKGRVVAATGGAHYLFLGSPWVTDIGDLTRFGLTLDDLPAHESTSELLFLLQSQRRALEESRGLTAALREREGVLRSVLDTVADAIITTDASGTIRSFNAAATRVFGYTPDEVLGQNADILLARPYSRVPSPHAENPGTPSWTVPGSHLEVDGLTKAGTRISLQLTTEATGLDHECLLTCTFHDLTEKNRAHSILLRSERQMRRILDLALDAVVSITMQGAIVHWNAEAERIFGWSPDEVIGRDLATVILPMDARGYHAHGLEAFRPSGGELRLGQRFEIEAVNRDGQVVPVELALAEINDSARGDTAVQRTPHDSCQETVAYVGFLRDIRPRRAVEVSLRQAKSNAEAIAKARSDFLAMMSHEIRTPLNGVIGMIHLALKESMSDGLFEHLSRALRSAHLLLSVTNDVLDFSKIEAGRLPIHDECFDLDLLVRDTIATVQPQARGGVTLTFRLQAGLPTRLSGDPVRIQQILVNLLGNAAKFTERGYVRLEITASGSSGDHRQFRFTVEDTGIGVPHGQRETIFQPFRQGDRFITRRFGGTGLGLPISSQLASLMQGSLRLIRSSDEGSVFEFAVPLRVLEERRTRSRGPTAPQRRSGDRRESAGGSLWARRLAGHVLVVDDSMVNREVASAMLRHLGCTSDVAVNGREAVAAVANTEYDLILMDCQMPDMDGYEATRILRAAGHTETQLPIVAMTAGVLAEDRIRATAAGMNEHLSKPLLEDSLHDMLSRWLPAQQGTVAQTEPVIAQPHPDATTIARRRELLASAADETWRSLADTFADTARRAAAQCADEDVAFPEVARIAHELKGSAGMIGATRLAHAASALEAAARTGSAVQRTSMARTLATELTALLPLLLQETQ